MDRLDFLTIEHGKTLMKYLQQNFPKTYYLLGGANVKPLGRWERNGEKDMSYVLIKGKKYLASICPHNDGNIFTFWTFGVPEDRDGKYDAGSNHDNTPEGKKTLNQLLDRLNLTQLPFN